MNEKNAKTTKKTTNDKEDNERQRKQRRTLWTIKKMTMPMKTFTVEVFIHPKIL